MPVLGLVLVLENSEVATRQRVQAALAGVQDLDLGEAAAHRLPAVLETASEREGEARVDWLRSLTGVAGVDIVYADFEDLLVRSQTADAREDV